MECFHKIDSIRLPPFESCFPVRCHPRYAALSEQVNAWVRSRSGNVLPDLAVEKLCESQFAWLSCLLWPNGTDDGRSLSLLKLMYWIALFDNMVDNPRVMGSDAQAVQGFCRHLLKAMFGDDDGGGTAASIERFSVEKLLSVAVAVEWWGEIRRSGSGMPPKQQARFAEVFKEYVMTHIGLAGYREKEELPDLEQYIAVRRIASTARLLLVATEYDLCVELDDHTLNSSLLKQLQDAVCDHIGWTNDLYSFAKEYLEGDYFNLLAVLHYRNNSRGRRRRTSIQNAASQAWAMIKSREQGCARLAREIKESATEPALHMYVDAACSMTAGNWLWSSTTPRYKAMPENIQLLPRGGGRAAPPPPPTCRKPRLFSLFNPSSRCPFTASPSGAPVTLGPVSKRWFQYSLMLARKI